MPFGLGKCKNSTLKFKAAGAYSLYGAHSVNYLKLVILQGLRELKWEKIYFKIN